VVVQKVEVRSLSEHNISNVCCIATRKNLGVDYVTPYLKIPEKPSLGKFLSFN
jgi:hypothetical protein